MAIMKKYALEKQYVQVPNETAKSVEDRGLGNEISLEALGLIVNLWSYDVTKWELHKTELYRRFMHNKRTSVTKAWNQLIEANYVLEFKFRKGKDWEYVYVYRIEPFSEEEIKTILEDSKQEYGEVFPLKLSTVEKQQSNFSTVDFEQSNLSSPICAVQNQHIINKNKSKKELKKKEIKEKRDLKELLEEEGQENFQINNQAFSEFVFYFKETFPNAMDEFTFKAIYKEMLEQQCQAFTIKEAIRQAREMKKKTDEGLKIFDYAKYFVTGILKSRASYSSNKIAEQMKELQKELKAQKELEYQKRANFVYYNWLEEGQGN